MFLSKRSLCISNTTNDSNSFKLNTNIQYVKKGFSKQLFKNQFDLISKYKKFIDSVDESKKWDHAKKLSNHFELINVSHHNKSSIAFYIPLSRSYFKFWEIITDFNIIDNNKKSYRYAALAEGPGGFIECFINYRKKDFMGRNDDIFAITLYSDKDQDIPDIDSPKFNNIQISYGKDGTGNLYNLDNIIEFREQCGGKESIDIVSADGGFDFSINFNEQEQLSYRLLLCEIVSALSINSIGGTFVLKVFDTFTILTNKLIFLLTKYYSKVFLTKPHTSRPANSEKYIVCTNFTGISDKNLDQLFNIIKNWDKKITDTEYVYDIFSFSLPTDFTQMMYEYNNNIIKNQLLNILKTFMYIDYHKMSGKDISIRKQKQTLYAIEWCKKYNQPININSKFIKMNHFLK
jgi:23S rRNA U2552 (ribose-2'-O)-methylase RlmE/FtsJ